MMKKINLLFLIVFLFFGCKGQEGSYNRKSPILSSHRDTTLTQSGVYLLLPSKEEIRELKNRYGEEQFYVLADDANGYVTNISDLLDGNITYIKNDRINFKNSDLTIDKSTFDDKWLILDYSNIQEPKIYLLVDFYTALNEGNHIDNEDTDLVDVFQYDFNNDYLIDKVELVNYNDKSVIRFYKNQKEQLIKIYESEIPHNRVFFNRELSSNNNGLAISIEEKQQSIIGYIEYKNRSFKIANVCHTRNEITPLGYKPKTNCHKSDLLISDFTFSNGFDVVYSN